MKVQDVFRAQYFLANVERWIEQLEFDLHRFPCFATSLKDLLLKSSISLLIELDQTILPSIVFEIHKAKGLSLLQGNVSEARYVSFFIREDGYTDCARELVLKYPFLFEMLDGLTEQSFRALALCIERYWHDRFDLRIWLELPSTVKITHIEPLKGADRHQRQQAFLITFSDGSKVIYKPVDLNADLLLKEFTESLSLPPPYNLKAMEVLPQKGYGWIKYINAKPCNSIAEVQDFYIRQGVLLAVADALNYTDGHCENLIADGAFPILIDGETCFQNYHYSIVTQKNILSTMLIQKLPELPQEEVFLNSAIQAPFGFKCESLETHAVNDHTDEIEIRYRGINPAPQHHCPIFNNEPINAIAYVEFILRGYCFAYDYITSRASDILNAKKWWEKLGRARSRIVLRETATYLYLLRCIQQPDLVISRDKCEAFLREKLGNTPYTNYEVRELLALNIPYFYHLPEEHHLYDSSGNVYPNVFPHTALESLKKQFLERSDEKKAFDCQIISRHLTLLGI